MAHAERRPAASGADGDAPDDAIFHDPVHDGATDPTVIRHRGTGEWWMFFTQRRATVDEPGVAWVHGSRIGIARSSDGLDWRYVGTVDGLEADAAASATDRDRPRETHWAPEVIAATSSSTAIAGCCSPSPIRTGTAASWAPAMRRPHE
ncbi:hypothetical protein [Agromyces aureus]|nr:hypothetical protein [Agromyces aureus]